MQKLYSFDIFDTCITRACGSSENIFYLLALEFIQDDDKSKVMGFIHDRQQAEKDSYRLFGKECPTINDIYELFDTGLYTDVAKEIILHRECELDIQSFIPVKKTMELISSARRKGRVVFISDMYIPKDTLYKRLVELGVTDSTEQLYVSCDCGVSKYSGRLYDFVSEKEGVKFNQWTHYGDDYHNDYLMPRKKGIKAIKIKTNFSKYESIWNNEASLMGDKSISVMSSIFRSIRLQNFLSDNDEFVPNIMAAVFVPFVVTLLQHARKLSITRLFFASRDTYLMFLLAQQFSSVFNNIELKYLNISTKVLYPCHIKEGTVEEIVYILGFVNNISCRSAMTLLGFDKYEIEEVGKNIDVNVSLSTDTMRREFADELLKGGRKVSLINRCCKKKNLLLSYLRQEGFISSGKIGLIDLGWNCTSQIMLNEVLPINNTVYYYWGVLDTRRPFNNTGSFFSFIYGEEYKELCIITNQAEHFMCRTLEGSTIGYQQASSEIIPNKEHVSFSMEFEKEVTFNQSVVLQIGKKFMQYFSALDSCELFFKTCTLRTCQDYLRYPRYSLVKTIAGHLDVEHYSVSRPIFAKLYPLKYLRIIYHYKLMKEVGTYMYLWHDGSIVYTYGKFGEWIVRNRLLKKCNFLIKNILRRLL